MINPLTKITPIKLNSRLQLIVAAGIVVAGTSTAVAYNTLSNTEAGDTPVEVKVDDHEKRISKTEQDIAETKTRVDGVEQKTDENTQAVREVERQVVAVDGKASAAQNAAKQAQQAAQAAPAPQPASTPVPARTISPRLITAVVATEQFDRFNNSTGWNCTYTVETGKTIAGFQSAPCNGVGSEISDELAVMNGVR